MLKPDYDNSILSLSNSILKHYDVEHQFPTLEKIDKLLDKNYKNVVVMLFDALGEYNLDMMKEYTKNLNNHKIAVIDSVFPPTTTAATTTLLSALPPATHNWLGWSLYFKQEDSNVNIFVNTNDRNKAVFDKDVVNTYLPYVDIFDKINEKGTVKADNVSFFGSVKADTLYEITTSVRELCQDDERRFIYCYCNEPDRTMHRSGIRSDKTVSVMKLIDEEIRKLAEDLDDTLLIITGDHGHIDGIPIKLSEYPDVKDTLLRNPSIEPRANAIFVKEGRGKEFEALFEKYFSDDFILLTHKEVVEEKLFGEEIGETYFEDFIGDYLMISIKDKSLFFDDKKAESFIGVHAGLTNEELKIPLIVFECE